MQTKTTFITGVLFVLTAIIMGAFATHSLSEVLSAKNLNSFNVGIDYQLYHGFALLITVALYKTGIVQRLKYVILFWILGWLFFSGSIYLLATQSLLNIDVGFLGPITPIGGLFLMIGWVILLIEGITSLTIKNK